MTPKLNDYLDSVFNNNYGTDHEVKYNSQGEGKQEFYY